MKTIDEIVCPYCKHEDLITGDSYEEWDSETEICENCGKKFNIECVSVERTFETKKV